MTMQKQFLTTLLSIVLSTGLTAQASNSFSCCKKEVDAKKVYTDELFVKDEAVIKGDLCVKGLISRCPKNNIYWLGDSLNDMGNLKALAPQLAVDIDIVISIDPFIVIKVRFNETGRNSNGLVQTDFLADLCGYKLSTASKLKCLPKGHGNFVNFAISGASQNNNTNLYLATLPPSLSIGFQIEQLCALLDKAGTSLASDDICIMQSTANDTFMLLLLLIGAPGNISQTPEQYIEAYITSAIANIDTLYNKGCRTLFLQIFDQMAPLNMPFFTKFNEVTAPFDITAAIDNALVFMQGGLRAAIAANVATIWPDLDVTIINETVVWEDIMNNPNQFGVRQTVGVQTMTDLGWPAILAENVFYFDDVHPTQHTHKLRAGFVENWFTKCNSQQGSTGCGKHEDRDWCKHIEQSKPT